MANITVIHRRDFKDELESLLFHYDLSLVGDPVYAEQQYGTYSVTFNVV